jgi:hypothetical protein
MEVTTASGDIAIRQTRQYHRYQPGKSQFILCTFIMNEGQANTTQRVGYFDANDGIFLELSGTSLRIVRRTSTSGSPVDNAIEQADWNIDDLPGLDITKAQIFFIDLEWLGVGQVRTGFVIDGEFKHCHHFKNANNLGEVYMKTANLPVRYEIRNTGTAAAGATLHSICCTVISEGGFEADRGLPFCASNGTTVKLVDTSAIPVISIRPKQTFNSITNRGKIDVSGINGYANGEAAYVTVVYNGTLTGANWQSVNTNSIVEVDTSATSISGGQVINAFYAPAGSQGNQSSNAATNIGVLSRLPLVWDVSASAATILSVVAQSFNATSSVSTALFWQEQR